MSEIAIKLESVSKFYKLYGSSGDRLKEALNPFGRTYHSEYYAINNISLEVRKGEILGIVGKNGCGKSTLLKMIAHVLMPSSGKVYVDGRMSAMLELGSGFNPEFTGVQNIYFYLTILGLSQEEIDNRLDRIIEFADIGQFLYQPLKTYSSGMRSRLGFAVAINIDPDILILDEVLAVGDIDFQSKCYSKMRELFKRGKTVVFVSHSPRAIIDFCTRAVLIFDGEAILDGDPKEIIDSYQKITFSKNSKEAANELIKNNEIVKGNNVGYKQDSTVVKPESFDEALKLRPMTTQVFDVGIENVSIINKEGLQVNRLKKGDEYSVEYTVMLNMEDAVTYLSTGMAITDVKGVIIGASRDYIEPFDTSFTKGGKVAVKRTLTMELVGGRSYIVKIDVMGRVHDKEELLYSIANALIFEVNKEKRQGLNRLNGLVDLNQNVCMEILD